MITDMEADYLLRNDQISDCRSFSSIHHASSQQRKMSIGITVESSAKRRLGILNKINPGVPTSANANTKEKDVAGGETVTTKRKKKAPSEQEGSPWITKKSAHQLSSVSEVGGHAEVAGIKQKNGLCNKRSGLKNTSTANEVQFFPIQTSILERNDASKKRLDDIAHNSDGDKNDKTERIEKSTSATEQVFREERQPVSDKNENNVKAQSEVLRMKLWELLETVCSPNREKPTSEPVDAGGTAMESQQKIKHTSGLTGKIRQNSDTIETDSENPSCKNWRPVTRSLTRNRDSTRVQGQKPKHVPSGNKQKCGEEGIFSFEEGLNVRGNGASSTSIKKKISGVKSSGLVPRKILFQSMKNKDKTRQVVDRTEKLVSAERSSSRSSRMGGKHTHSSCINQNKIEKEKIAVEKKFIEQPGRSKADQHEEISTPAWPEKADPPDGVGTSSFKKFLDQNDSRSPKFKPPNPVTCSSPEMEQRDGDHEPADRIQQKGGDPSNKGLRKLHSGNSFQYERKYVPSGNKQKCREKNIFSFEEGLIVRGHGASLSSTKKNTSTFKSSGIVLQKILFQSTKNEDKTRQVADRTEKSVLAERSTSRSSRMGGLHTRSSHINQNKIEKEKIAVEKEFIEQPGKSKADQHEEISSPAWPDKTDPPNGVGTSSFKKFLDPNNSGSPTFKPPTPLTCSSPEMEQRDGDHEPADRIKHKGGDSNFCFSLRNKGSGKLHSANSSQSEPFDKATDLQDSALINSDLHMKENDGEESPLLSVSEGRGSEIYGKDLRKERIVPSRTGTCEKSKPMLRQMKRFCSYQGNQSDECSPSPSSPKGTGESNWAQEQDEQNAEDGMARATGLLSLALEKLKGKVKLATRNKSSEILKSTAERIHIEFQSVESQIQTDMGKLRSFSRQKRKRLESDFKEKELKLIKIHERFREELSQHIQDCRGIVAGLEKNQIELSDIAKEKKAAYQKLISQAEEAAQNQLHDAENRIKAIHELARKQMHQVKSSIAECLQGGILS